MKYKRRRLYVLLFLILALLGGYGFEAGKKYLDNTDQSSVSTVLGVAENGDVSNVDTRKAVDVLEELEVKGRAPKTGYKRDQYGSGWAKVGQCDVRNFILKRDLTEVVVKSDQDCTVLSGRLDDPYTAKSIEFKRGPDTSDDVQIDHVVALSDSWQKGAQGLSPAEREALANDPLNLLAVEGKVNSDKGDGDAATWLPPNKSYRCRYVARQIAVKQEYRLWVTEAEKTAMKRVLKDCPDQVLPLVRGN